MLDIRLVRESPDAIRATLKMRNSNAETFGLLDKICRLDSQWRGIKKEEEGLRAERNRLSLIINDKKKKGEPVEAEIGRSGEVAGRIKQITLETQTLEDQIREEALLLPNIPDKSVPEGADATHNPVVRTWGEPDKHPADVIEHHELGERSGLIDFERGVKLAKHRFSVLSGPLARMERALVTFMLSVHTSKGYKEYAPPYLVNTKTMRGTGQLPKFREELYQTQDDLWLIPTAEVPLTNLYAGEILEEKNLPLKLTAYTPSFRREAGAYGKDIRGLIRQHQFDKVELVKIAHPERSFEELESMLRDAESILQLLKLPYRVVELCTGDLGFASAKTYDIETWLPSQDCYREISSCSNCTDFQARRADIRFRGAGRMGFVHTLNGSGLAVGRTLVAILENCQEDKKTIVVPKALQDFMGQDSIEF
jgi:seryl-tRNA synthetase